MNDKPRLIEVAFPLKQASVASVHEKNVRHGHISSLHIWPARRPLAACRAALLATLLPDPGDAERRRLLLDEMGGQVVTRTVEETDDDGKTSVEDKEFVVGGVLGWGSESCPTMDAFRDNIRKTFGGEPPTVLDPFAGGGAIPLEAMRLGCKTLASDINPVAWFILKSTLEYPHRCSGKRWPLPSFVRDWPDFIEDFLDGKLKKRKGNKKPHFTDPKQLALMDLPDADLPWHIRAWGRWVFAKCRADLDTKYPMVGGEPTVAYLWARTARDRTTAGRIPLLKTFWLCRKKGRRAALLPRPLPDKTGVEICVLQEADLIQPRKVIDDHPFLREWGVTPESISEFLSNGTMNRAGVWSPLSGRPGMVALTMEDLRRQGQQGLLDTQMTAVVVESQVSGTNKRVKKYRSTTSGDLKSAESSPEELEQLYADIPFGVPDERLPPPGSLGFRVPLYGFKLWRDMFTKRQLYSLGVLVKHIRSATAELKLTNPELAEPVTAGLALGFDRLLDFANLGVQWKLDAECINHALVRYALPMTWDFGEPNMIGEHSGSYLMCLDRVCEALDNLALNASPAPSVSRASAIKSAGSPVDVYITDPPYYGAIPYSDLSDLFYIWLKRLTTGLAPEYDSVMAAELAPKWDHALKDGELVDDDSRFGGDKAASKQSYEDGMARTFETACVGTKEYGRIVVVFANKDVDAWETLVAGLIRGGAVVTASWPIQTEQPSRMRGISSAALSASVWIVCRKRPKSSPPGWEERVIEQMKETLFGQRESLGNRNVLQYFFDLGIQGPDFIWAALGPALEAYSAHPFVKKTAGGLMTVNEFLKEVRKLVLQFSLGELPGFRDAQKETQGRGESLEIDPVTQYYLLHRAYFSLTPAPAGACILFANACGKNETELKVVWNILEQGGKPKGGRPRKEDDDIEDAADEARDGKGNEYRLLTWQERAMAEGLGESKSGTTAPLIDKLHRLMFLFQQNRTVEVQQLFEAWGLSNEKAFKPLLQAVRELAVRDKQDAERRLVEALATQLRMNRKTVVVANEMKEVPLFDSVEDAGQMQIS